MSTTTHPTALQELNDAENRVISVVESISRLLGHLEHGDATGSDIELHRILNTLREIKHILKRRLNQARSQATHEYSVYSQREDADIVISKAQYIQQQLQTLIDYVDSETQSFSV